MKKVFLSLIGISALLFSCTREQLPTNSETENIEHESFSITAIICDSQDVKTVYDDSQTNPTFSWLATDRIAVQLENRNSAGSYDQWQFVSNGTGATASFSADESSYTLNITDTWKLATYAFYPKHAADANEKRDLVFDNSNDRVYLQPESKVSKSELTSLVPLIGVRDNNTSVDSKSGVVYNFKTATGALRVSLKNTPSTVKKIKVTAASVSGYLAGYVRLSNIADSEISIDDIYSNGKNTKIITLGFAPTEGEDLVVYVPIPTGTLTGGLTISVLGENDAEIISRTTGEDVVITRNSLIAIPDIVFDSDWTSIGTGWYGDNYLFPQIGQNGKMVSVDFQQNKTIPNQYRIRNPYGSLSLYGVTLTGFHNSYLTFTISGTSVSFEDHKTGIQLGGLNTMISDDSSSTKETVRYDSSNPKYIQLAPRYYQETSTGSKDYSSLRTNRSGQANMINIVFPGYSVGEAWGGDWAIKGDSRYMITVEGLEGDADYNVKITRYQNTASSIYISGVCKGVYDPQQGTITFPLLQEFADTGETWSSSDSYNGSSVAYSFRGKLNGATQALVFSIQNYDARLVTTSDTFCLGKYVVKYESASGYTEYQSFSGTPTFTKQ